ncbi:putative phosphatidate phosphatase isoform X2 [Teleopsis dalmanni]|uniref:putative phosphatidate phosphatase isoform X2 n=1 Tax=Teleopsis dalmanni TaxID=139649 RepID=UPI0018CCB98C|nr:putative phosphatidate phosphatase isoform X2 [Teleopsis dalmanni]
MSNDSSASETTPLRRPENQLSEDVRNNIATTSQHSRNQNVDNGLQTNKNHNLNGNKSNNISSDTTVTLNNRNNNNFEVHLGNSINNNNNNSTSQLKMETNKRILYRVGLDVLILLCVGFPILCFFLFGSAYKRGFFCDDESLKHPFKESTVRNWMLYFIGLVLPIGAIIIVEVVRSKHNAKTSNGNNISRPYVFMDYEIPDWMVECYKKIGIFGFGAAVCQMTTDIAKYSIGRLRPHFFAVCQPMMSDGSTCADTSNAGKYIQDFRCIGEGSSARMLKEIRLSFPSGHSSFTFFTMVYLALYLQSRMTWRGSKLLRHFLQFIFIMIAWYTALSRVSDYKHHWSDVLAGSTIGSLCAIIVSYLTPDNWFNWKTVWPIEHKIHKKLN